MKILLVACMLTIIVRSAFSAPAGSEKKWICVVGDVQCKKGDSGAKPECKGNNLYYCVNGYVSRIKSYKRMSQFYVLILQKLLFRL